MTAMKPYSSQIMPFQFWSARIFVDNPKGSKRPMIDTNVVSLNSPMKLDTIFGIEIFSACGIIISRVAFQKSRTFRLFGP